MNENLNIIHTSLLAIIELATCDKSLFSDGIDEEIVAFAKRGLWAYEKALSDYARQTCEQDG